MRDDQDWAAGIRVAAHRTTQVSAAEPHGLGTVQADVLGRAPDPVVTTIERPPVRLRDWLLIALATISPAGPVAAATVS